MQLRRSGRFIRQIVTCLAIFILVTEMACRFLLGLGDPPLVVRDDNCGYRFAPSQAVRRFGNHISYDEVSSRGRKPLVAGEDVWTTLVVGDSVVDGLALTDDDDTVTGLLNEAAIDYEGHRLVFRTLAAGSWGTPQQLGYLKAYGTLGANAVVLVLNSGDTTTPVVRTDPVFPTLKPWTATEELVMRYALRSRGHLFGPSERGSVARAADVPPEILRSSDCTDPGRWCLAEMLRLGRQQGVPMAILVWPGCEEATQGLWGREVDVMRVEAERAGVRLVSLMNKVRERRGFERRLYRDGIHPTDSGNRLIAGAVVEIAQVLFDERARSSSRGRAGLPDASSAEVHEDR